METLLRSKTIVGIYQEHNEKCRALIGKEFNKSTVDKFDTSLNHIKNHIKFRYKKKDLPLEQVNRDFIQGFDFYLKTECGNQQNSTVKHLKKVIRIALANDWIHKDPFMGITLRYDKPEIEKLTKEELMAIIEKECEIKRLEVVRDIFVFCCSTGLAFIDCKKLSKKDLVTDSEGKVWIIKDRQKTHQASRVPILDIPLRILANYADDHYYVKNKVLLPVRTNQKMNEYLKEIAYVCGISKNLHTHLARHTCATTVLLNNGMALHQVSKVQGHSSSITSPERTARPTTADTPLT